MMIADRVTAFKQIPRWLVLSAVVYIACILFLDLIPFRVGIDTQAKRCLPGAVYLLDLRNPEPVVGDIVSYGTVGLKPWVEDGTVFTKLVFAGPGDTVNVRSNEIMNGNARLPVELSSHVLNKIGLSMHDATKVWHLGSNEYFLVGTLPNAFDSRYTGPVKRQQIFAKALPLW